MVIWRVAVAVRLWRSFFWTVPATYRRTRTQDWQRATWNWWWRYGTRTGRK